MRCLSLVLLAACAAAPSAQQSPPPAALELDHTPVVIEDAMTLTATGAQPGDTVYFGLGNALGAGPCPASLGACLGITGNVQLLATAPADSTGTASVTLTVPASVPEGAPVAFQAAVLGANAALSMPTLTEATHFWSSITGDVLIAGLSYDLHWHASPSLSGAVSLRLGGTTVPVASLPSTQASMLLPLLTPTSRNYTLQLDAGPLGLFSSPSFPVGALVGFDWDGTEERMLRFDPLTGQLHPIGVVDDLAFWGGRTLFDADNDRVYVIGTNAAGDDWIYRMGTDGSYQGKTALNVQVGGPQLLSDGTILSFSWDGTQELMQIIEPNTGLVITRGVVPDLMWWSNQTFVDESVGLVWVIGTTAAGDDFIWVMDLATGAPVDAIPLSDASQVGGGLKLRNDGKIVGARWNGTFEELVETDLSTGITTVIGQVGDLAFWSGRTVLTPGNDQFFVWGNNNADEKLWALDPYTGAMLDEYVLPASTSMSGQQLVY
jgi:hypothetical protein